MEERTTSQEHKWPLEFKRKKKSKKMDILLEPPEGTQHLDLVK
jgi:hypothetical protein